MISALILSVLINSMAFAESNPRVELSQHCKGAPATAASAMVILFRSPPETPRMKSFPTFVLTVWLRDGVKSEIRSSSTE
jgi:hypothetical protein